MHKIVIKHHVEKYFGYHLEDTIEHLHRHYSFDETCQGSVPQAIIVFLESEIFEDAIRKAIYIGGDSDTIACMVGGIAQAFYGGVPKEIRDETLARLDERLRKVFWAFHAQFPSL